MAARSNEYRKTLHHHDGIDRLMAAGVPIHQIEEMLDEVEYEEARHLRSEARGLTLFGCLLWI